MNKLSLIKLAPFALVAGMTISGCGEKSECELPTRHVHKYVKQIDDDITIDKYLDDERLNISGYQWSDDYIEITKEDEKFYKLIERKKIFEGNSNWEYLYNKMSSNHDYLEFYYRYTTTRRYTDSEGRRRTRRVVHTGWHTNPNSINNTGKTRLCHHRYIGYKVINKNGRFKLEESPAVDDIREIIDEYPYFKEDCEIIVTSDNFEFSKSELPYLKAEDFNVFKGPDLENKELTIEKSKIKTIKY